MLFGLLITAAFGATLADIAGIRNLMGEPDYRKVRLHWEGDNNPDLQYQIRYCELQTWGPQRCRLQTTYNMDNNNIEDNSLAYVADIKGLRMATTYSFEVRRHVKKELIEREERADDGDDRNQNVIVLPTKGFSARATQCLPHASEIEVSTGPYFGGRIAVEAADGERCALDGEPTSPRDTYTLRINHTECGSQVNETTVATFVLVQENLPILTHSTRRFLVLCSYQPETLTVRAGINLPNRHLGRGQAHVSLNGRDEDGGDVEDNSLKERQGRSFRSGRLMIQKPEALVKEGDEIVGISSKTNIVPILVITMLSLAGVIGIVAVILKLASKKILKEFDDVSIASEISTSSCSTMDYNNPRNVSN